MTNHRSYNGCMTGECMRDDSMYDACMHVRTLHVRCVHEEYMTGMTACAMHDRDDCMCDA